MDGIGRRITHWRKLADLSQSDLARACGVSPGAVWQWENDKTPPTLKNIAKIAKACGVELRTFFADLSDADESSEPPDDEPERKAAGAE